MSDVLSEPLKGFCVASSPQDLAGTHVLRSRSIVKVRVRRVRAKGVASLLVLTYRRSEGTDGSLSAGDGIPAVEKHRAWREGAAAGSGPQGFSAGDCWGVART